MWWQLNPFEYACSEKNTRIICRTRLVIWYSVIPRVMLRDQMSHLLASLLLYRITTFPNCCYELQDLMFSLFYFSGVITSFTLVSVTVNTWPMLVWNFLAPSPPWSRLICQDVIFKIRALQHWVTTQSSVTSHSPNVQTSLTLGFRWVSDLRSSEAIVELKSGDSDTLITPFPGSLSFFLPAIRLGTRCWKNVVCWMLAVQKIVFCVFRN